MQDKFRLNVLRRNANTPGHAAVHRLCLHDGGWQQQQRDGEELPDSGRGRTPHGCGGCSHLRRLRFSGQPRVFATRPEAGDNRRQHEPAQLRGPGTPQDRIAPALRPSIRKASSSVRLGWSSFPVGRVVAFAAMRSEPLGPREPGAVRRPAGLAEPRRRTCPLQPGPETLASPRS